MPIPKKVSNDFFVPPINPFYIEEDNEAAIIDESIYDFEPYSFSFEPYIADFGYSLGQETSYEYINSPSPFQSYDINLDVYELGKLLFELIVQKYEALYHKSIKEMHQYSDSIIILCHERVMFSHFAPNTKQNCLQIKKLENTFLSDPNCFKLKEVEYTFLSDQIE